MFQLIAAKYRLSVITISLCLGLFFFTCLSQGPSSQAHTQRPGVRQPGTRTPTPTPTRSPRPSPSRPTPTPDLGLQFDKELLTVLDWNGKKPVGRTKDVTQSNGLKTLLNEYELEVGEPVDFQLKLQCQDCQNGEKWKIDILDPSSQTVSTSIAPNSATTSQSFGGTFRQKGTYRITVRYLDFNFRQSKKPVQYRFTLFVTRQMAVSTYLARVNDLRAEYQRTGNCDVIGKLETLAQQLPGRPEAMEAAGTMAWICKRYNLARQVMEKTLEAGGTVSFETIENKKCREIDMSNPGSIVKSSIKLRRGGLEWTSCADFISAIKKDTQISLDIRPNTSIIEVTVGRGGSAKRFYFSSGTTNRSPRDLFDDAEFIKTIVNKYLRP